MSRFRTTVATLLVVVATTSAALGQTPIATQRVISGVTRPVFVTAPLGDNSRIFVVEQRGVPSATQARILVYSLPSYSLLGTFWTVSGLTTGNEQGLLGLAFDPNYMTNGRFYLDYTNSAGTTIIERHVDTNPNDNVCTNAVGYPNTVISIAQPFSNHNGGWIAFGPDGLLYIAMGDGGSANDPGNRAQNLTLLLGKMLRLDVSGAAGYTIPPTNPFAGGGGAGEIWHYGLRNPWRNSFDRLTGALYIGDVGQGAWEEVDYIAPGVGGVNLYWRCMEGRVSTGLSGCTPIACPGSGGTYNQSCPLAVYDHAGRCSVTGGYVYRGSVIPDLQGTYFYADYCSNQIFSFNFNGLVNPTPADRTAQLSPSLNGFAINSITSFGEDNAGEMYIVDQGGEIFKIVVNCAGSSLTFSSGPGNQSVCQGATVNFSVSLNGARGAVTYSWRKNGGTIGAPSLPTLTLSNVQPSDAGSYDCLVQDQCNVATSSAGVLTVQANATANAGGPYTMCNSAVAYPLNGSGADFGAVTWSTSGTGSFSNPNILNPTYTPSAADLTAGTITLTLDATAISPCTAPAQSQATVTMVPGQPVGDIDGDCVLTPNDRVLFVNVLLGLDGDPGRVLRSDINGDMTANGDDVQPFVALPVPP